MRCFVAIDLDPTARQALADLSNRMRRRLPAASLRWVDPQHIHLTVKFLGELKPDESEAVVASLTEGAARVGPADLTLTGLGAFPNAARARVIWVGIQEASGRLSQLHQATEQAMATLGYQRDERAFQPHLTVARVRPDIDRTDREALAAGLRQEQVGELAISRMAEVVLFRSDLRPSGAVYTPLARLALGPITVG